ncbi:MAG: apolipoprotein N-acyltransferase [Proteobacteria bacterium]|nr:apolipoprotein N-acyltransferase [Pseudomonadota bacterium]
MKERLLCAFKAILLLGIMLAAGMALTLALAPPTQPPPILNWKDLTPFSLWHYTTSAYLWPIIPLAFYAAINLSKRYLLNVSGKMLGTYIFALGYFITSLYWISYSLSIDAAKFGWLKPFSVLGIPALLALPYSFVGLLCHISKTERYHWVFVHSWFLIEMLRSYIFPVNLLGDMTMASIHFVQFASVVGVYGMTAVVLWLSGAIAGNKPKEIMVAMTVFIVIYAFGYHRLTNQEPVKFHDVEVLLVQPNNPFNMGDDAVKQTSIDKLRELSSSIPYSGKQRYIIWPEASWPKALELLELPPDGPVKGHIVQWGEISMFIPGNNKLVFGYDRLAYNYNKADNKFDKPIMHNSMAVLDNMGRVLSNYDKRLLVPFGEYVPMRWMLALLMEKVAYGQYDFSPGETSNLMDMGELKAIPLICYEAIFSHYLQSFDTDKADFMIAITNDSWFGAGLGPYQHFAMARMRTIEYGMPMMRAANDGITAVINPYGQVVQTVARWRAEKLLAMVQIKLQHKTLYSKAGGIILLSLILTACIVVGLSARWR